MNIYEEFRLAVVARVEALAAVGALPPGLDTGRIVVEPPRESGHGDLTTNAAMALAKQARLSPRALADVIAAQMRAIPGVASVEVAGPGFINASLDAGRFLDVLRGVLREGADFGRAPRGEGPRINVEYVSANPTGPMHVGHGRGAVFGDALANLLAFAGHDVAREYYVNDAGAQVDTLARSAFLRYREALGEPVGAIPEGLYPGDYLVPVGQALAAEHGRALLDRPEEDWLPLVREAATAAMIALIRGDLAALDVRHDVFFSERSLHAPADRVRALVEDLRARDLVYEGVLPRPKATSKGAADEEWEEREQTLFRATKFGDDVDRPLMKSDGSYTYFASDIAYHRSKFERGCPLMIDVWGADHGGYVKRMQAAVTAVTEGQGALEVRLCQLVRLLRAGEPVKMSKRSGDFVTLREVVDEVGRDAVRFIMLMRKNDAPLDFDLAKVIEQSKDNPVFYVQYAHARCRSVFRQATEAMGGASGMAALGPLADAPLDLLRDEAELDLVKRIAQYPRIVEGAAAAREPHRLAFYLYDLASLFHALWNRGKDDPRLRFINQGDPVSTSARLALVQATQSVIASGLAILGVVAPEEMR